MVSTLRARDLALQGRMSLRATIARKGHRREVADHQLVPDAVVHQRRFPGNDRYSPVSQPAEWSRLLLACGPDAWRCRVSLHLVPVRSREAADFVRQWHRHHRPPVGQVFAVGAADQDDVLRAVAIVGRPVARHLDNGMTLEVTRTCSDGTRNANSLLYGAAWRAAKALGYARLITYTQAGESGSSLRGAGWKIIAQRSPQAGWDRPSRPRRALGSEYIARTLWEAS
jgi:hypothetical protein